MKPALVFEGKECFLCVSKSEDGGLEFYAQQNDITGAIINLPLKEIRELYFYLREHLGENPPPSAAKAMSKRLS